MSAAESGETKALVTHDALPAVVADARQLVHNPGDARPVCEALRDAPPDVSVVHDGAEALSLLNRANGYSAAPLPDLILLDLQ